MIAVDGDFTRGALVKIVDSEEAEIGRGLIAYGSEDSAKIIGHHSDAFEKLIGYKGPNFLLHCDNLALL